MRATFVRALYPPARRKEMMDDKTIAAILGGIAYKKGWHLEWGFERGFCWFEWVAERPDSYTGIVDIGRGGPVYVPASDLTEEGLVRMAFGAALRFEEHECREFFTYRGQRPFDPHKVLIQETVYA